MTSIKLSISALGYVLSILALGSIVVDITIGSIKLGEITEGVIYLYRSFRDLVFGFVGSLSSGVINLIAIRIDWLPEAPWFNLPSISKDTIALYTVFGSSLMRSIKVGDDTNGMLTRIKHGLFWPYYVYRDVYGLIKRNALFQTPKGYYDDHYKEDEKKPKSDLQMLREYINITSVFFKMEILRRWLLNSLYTMIGCTIFFLIAFAEYKIGF